MKRIAWVATALVGILCCHWANANELRVGLRNDPDLLDPHQSVTFAGRIVYTAMCDKLVDTSPQLKIVPQLATDWHWSNDGHQLIMNLRHDVQFQDHTPFNAEAVVANITRAKTMKESRRKSELASVTDIKATGPYQVTFDLSSPDVTLLSQLTDRAGMMLSPTAFKQLGTHFSDHPVCAGPFEFVSRVQQDRIVLKKFPQYWNAKNVFIDKVIYLPIPDSTVRLANLRSGDIDIVDGLAPTDITQVANTPGLRTKRIPGLGYESIAFNLNNGSMADNPLGRNKKIRQAFSLALDRNALNKVVYDGAYSAGNQPVDPNSEWYDHSTPVPARDLDKARQLMREAGVDHVKVPLMVQNTAQGAEIGQVIQAMTAPAGFDVSLQVVESATLLSLQSSGSFQAGYLSWSGRMDPDGNLFNFVTCKGGINDAHYCNPQVDSLLKQARMEADTNKRKALYDAANKILLDELPILYLDNPAMIWAYRDNIKGFGPSPDGLIRLTGMHITP